MAEILHFGSITVKTPATTGDAMAVLATLREEEKALLAKCGGREAALDCFGRARRTFAGFRKGKILAVLSLFDVERPGHMKDVSAVGMTRSYHALEKDNVRHWLKNYPAMWEYIRSTDGAKRRYIAACPVTDAGGMRVLERLLDAQRVFDITYRGDDYHVMRLFAESDVEEGGE